MPKSVKKIQIDACLDEIDVCIDHLENKPRKEQVSKLQGWIRKQKDTLKDLNYNGKIRRVKRKKD